MSESLRKAMMRSSFNMGLAGLPSAWSIVPGRGGDGNGLLKLRVELVERADETMPNERREDVAGGC